MKRLLAIVALLPALACAPTYGPADSDGYGYREERIAIDRYTVRFMGGHPGDSADFAMLRAAELTLEKGYRYFVVERVVDDSVAGHSGVYSSPTLTGVTADKQETTWTWRTAASGTTTLGVQFLTIRMLHEKPEGIGFVYEADTVSRSVRRKHDLVPPTGRPETRHRSE